MLMDHKPLQEVEHIFYFIFGAALFLVLFGYCIRLCCEEILPVPAHAHHNNHSYLESATAPIDLGKTFQRLIACTFKISLSATTIHPSSTQCRTF